MSAHHLPSSELAPGSGWQQAGERDHFVQFYDHDQFLLSSVAEFVGSGLDSDAACIVIAPLSHLQALEECLQEHGLNIVAARQRGQYVPLDATETLARICVQGWPQRDRFIEVIGPIIAEARRNYSRVLAFGELVALLCAQGRPEAAVHLEQLWNELGQRHHFSLYCAYPMSSFGSEQHAQHFKDVCNEHHQVFPTENYSSRPDTRDRLLMICELQQKASALQREVTERRRLEAELQDKLAELTEKDRRKDEFLAMLAHELRNPLAPLRNVTEMLKGLDPADPGRRQLHDMLDRQIAQLTRLLDDLLGVARPSATAVDHSTAPAAEEDRAHSTSPRQDLVVEDNRHTAP